MGSQGIHTKLLNQSAKEVLAPLGLIQHGHSRTWVDDRGWWVIVVCFESSAWRKGSYLTVAAMWLWKKKDSVSFDVGDRIGQFVEFESEAQFAPEAQRLALSAREHVLKMREQFVDIGETARFLHRRAGKARTHWPMFHAAVALGYAGKRWRARTCFNKLQRMSSEFDWQKSVQAAALEFAGLLNDLPEFRRRVRAEIFATRKLLKLPEREDLGLPK